MNVTKLVLLLVGVAVLTVFATIQLFIILDRPLLVEDTARMEYSFQVADTAGFDVSTDKLRLGAITHGSRARRSITVAHESASEVHVRVRGPGQGLLTTDPVHALINGSAEIEFVAAARPDTPFGTYEGWVYFYFI